MRPPTQPYVYIGGALVGGCDATKALIASGEFDKLLGTAAAAAAPPPTATASANGASEPGKTGGKTAGGVGALEQALEGLSAHALLTYDHMEDHIRPVVRGGDLSGGWVGGKGRPAATWRGGGEGAGARSARAVCVGIHPSPPPPLCVRR